METYRVYSGFPSCADRSEHSALSGVMASVTSIVLVAHISE